MEFMQMTHVWISMLAAATSLIAAETKPLYQNDFAGTAAGKVPSDMLVLDGGFAVREEGDAKFLELPGAPLETYGALYGPTAKENIVVTLRCQGTGKGRRFPTSAVGLGGVGGYRLQISPGKKELELFKGEADKASVPFAWPAGEWVWLKLQVRKVKEGDWRVEGKAWKQGAAEPAEWMISYGETEEPKAGRASLWGCPFAETPIRYDDLTVTPLP